MTKQKEQTNHSQQEQMDKLSNGVKVSFKSNQGNVRETRSGKEGNCIPFNPSSHTPVGTLNQTTEEYLKTCPFCGNEAKLGEDLEKQFLWITCTHCEIETRGYNIKKEDLIALWNQREELDKALSLKEQEHKEHIKEVIKALKREEKNSDLKVQQAKQELWDEIWDYDLGWNQNKSCMTISKKTLEEIKKRHNLK